MVGDHYPGHRTTGVTIYCETTLNNLVSSLLACKWPLWECLVT